MDSMAPSRRIASTGGPVRDPIGAWPLSVPCAGGSEPEPAGLNRWIWCFMALGIAARLVRYALNFPLGSDESYLACNLIDKGFADLTGPLNYEQVCPLLFLWGQLASVKWLGFSEYSLRLLPLTFGIGSVFLFRHVAGRLLRGTALVLAVGVFAAGYPGIRYSVEDKPYGADLFVALALLGLTVEWLRAPGRRGWLWGLAALLPLGIGLSYTAVFVAGGISLALAYDIWTRRLRAAWPVWVVYNLVLLESFLAFFALSTANQCSGCLTAMRLFWHDAFPPWDGPVRFAAWLVSAHSGVLLGHPFGGPHGGSTLTFMACLGAVAVLWRRRQPTLLLALLSPLALNFVAAAMQRYPYGGHVRLAMYFAPACCLLTGLGAAAGLAWLSSRRAIRPRWATLAFALVPILPIGSAVRDICRPYRAYEDVWTREFARSFWPAEEARSEVACLKGDLGLDFSPANFQMRFSAIYRCNQRIYSPRHVEGQPVDWQRISADWPLCCVEYKSTIFPYERQASAAWLQKMGRRYQLVDRRTLPMYVGKTSGEHDLDYVEIYRFVPRSELADRGGPDHREVR